MSELPRADLGRLEWIRRQAQVPVEEWVARNAHLLVTWGFGDFSYGDPELDAWVHAVPEIYGDKARLEDLQERYLTRAERAAMADDDGL
jgi:hypothetical protein